MTRKSLITIYAEANPFLGYRPETFKTQLRALLHAGVGHHLRIMFPMIATLNEAKRARNILYEAMAELASQVVPCAQDVQVGIMVEIPSVSNSCFTPPAAIVPDLRSIP